MKRVFAAILIFAFILAPAARAVDAPAEIPAEVDSADYVPGEAAAQDAIAGAEPVVAAPSAILIEKKTGTVIFEKNADERREPASVTKIMTLLLVVEALEEGAISLEDKVTCSAHAASMGGSQIYLREGEVMTVHELLKATVVNSANDAAVALGEYVAGSETAFVAKMNARAGELAMGQTIFTNCTGLLESKAHRTTARDIATMSRELIGHEMIREYTTIWMDSLRGGATELANTNRLIHYFDGATGLKTGFTTAAGYCLSATAERDGVEYISVTLGDKTSNDRFESARTLLTYAFAAYTLIAAEPDAALAPVKVELGKTRYIQPLVEGEPWLLVSRAELRTLTKTLEMPEKLTAPVAAGDEVGSLTIKSGEKVLAQVKIVAGEDSARLRWVDIFAEFLRMLFAPGRE
jgi:D-alanyl-D-alanine carboxypeptidase (penicillin-binding protein 5/6)